MKILKDSNTLKVKSENREWHVNIDQCFTHSKDNNEKTYKLDNEYILIVNNNQYGLMKIIDTCFSD
ncbi:MAG: hypothetical protein ABF289_09950 [Clostridiales bacterium]